MPRNNIAQKHDVVVIGAGPAGSEIAYRLATAGIDVLVVEKDHLDREKPCGGGIQIKELMDFGMPPAHVIERKITSVRIISSANDVLETRSNGKWPFSITVKRSVYDRHLQQRAARAGASFQSQARVTDILRNKDGFAVHLSTNQG